MAQECRMDSCEKGSQSMASPFWSPGQTHSLPEHPTKQR